MLVVAKFCRDLLDQSIIFMIDACVRGAAVLV